MSPSSDLPGFGLTAMPVLSSIFAGLLYATSNEAEPVPEVDGEARGRLLRQLDDAARAAELDEHLAQLTDAINDLQTRADEQQTAEEERKLRSMLLGTYTGPYVLLECTATGANVYPGGESLPEDPGAEALELLWKAVDTAGFVAVAVRENALQTTFPDFKQLILQHAENTTLGMSFFPIDDDESLEPYYPEETSHDSARDQ